MHLDVEEEEEMYEDWEYRQQKKRASPFREHFLLQT
jgi:hypothetical protein